MSYVSKVRQVFACICMMPIDYKWHNKANKSGSICIYGRINNGLGKNNLDCYLTLTCHMKFKTDREFVNYNLYNPVITSRDSPIDQVGQMLSSHIDYATLFSES